MAIPTQDPHVVIVMQGDNYVEYENTAGERWRITGKCNQCGECWVGSNCKTIRWTGKQIGEPGAIEDIRPDGERLDCPIRPEGIAKWPNCVLKGEYL